MTNTTKPEISICLVNYKTEEITRLCLRSIRKFTTIPCEVIVVDNGSNDGSLEYLRSLKWIKLVEHRPDTTKGPAYAHGSALDAGLAACDTPYFVSMHSDTILIRSGWLEMMMEQMRQHQAACVGSGKLENKPAWQLWLKKATDIQEWCRRCRKDGVRRDFYVRSICALYRTDVLRQENLSFIELPYTVGQMLYYKLQERHYPTVELSPAALQKYMFHLAHATMVINPEFKVRTSTEKKYYRTTKKILGHPAIQMLKNDASLDH